MHHAGSCYGSPSRRGPSPPLHATTFGVVKVTGDGWEPKAAFHGLGDLYRAISNTRRNGA